MWGRRAGGFLLTWRGKCENPEWADEAEAKWCGCVVARGVNIEQTAARAIVHKSRKNRTRRKACARARVYVCLRGDRVGSKRIDRAFMDRARSTRSPWNDSIDMYLYSHEPFGLQVAAG